MASLTPEVLWAQRSSKSDAEKNFIYLTIKVADVPASSLKLDLKPTGLTFSGHSDSLKRSYSLELEFYGEVDPAESKIHHSGRDVEIILRKKELDDAYWPRLLKESKKVHFLKTDFDKWVDEDEQNEAAEEDFSQFGGMKDLTANAVCWYQRLDTQSAGALASTVSSGNTKGCGKAFANCF
ncbi:HSP20-like chaperone [Lasiosphaeris hirsuta]|uniref:HSP20-like chaperone n=1 Tax=Lasiosphaeris hirsuta TaxID=260670 RepID=A0AA39ZXH7_9PEZI|nr:HSP20-like chaperone [Lasiosphaeris hirsuta]